MWNQNWTQNWRRIQNWRGTTSKPPPNTLKSSILPKLNIGNECKKSVFQVSFILRSFLGIKNLFLENERFMIARGKLKFLPRRLIKKPLLCEPSFNLNFWARLGSLGLSFNRSPCTQAAFVTWRVKLWVIDLRSKFQKVWEISSDK